MANASHNNDVETYTAVVDAARREILEKMPKPEPLGWKLLVIVLPVILTSILGAIVFKVQSNITSRLSLTQDYYRKRLEVYGHLYENLSNIRAQAKNALDQPTNTSGLDSTITTFVDHYSSNSIFLTQDLLKAANSMYQDSSRRLQDPTITPEFLQEVHEDADKVEQQMRKDLVVD